MRIDKIEMGYNAGVQRPTSFQAKREKIERKLRARGYEHQDEIDYRIDKILGIDNKIEKFDGHI